LKRYGKRAPLIKKHTLKKGENVFKFIFWGKRVNVHDRPEFLAVTKINGRLLRTRNIHAINETPKGKGKGWEFLF
jgi:hypothetical protein